MLLRVAKRAKLLLNWTIMKQLQSRRGDECRFEDKEFFSIKQHGYKWINRRESAFEQANEAKRGESMDNQARRRRSRVRIGSVIGLPSEETREKSPNQMCDRKIR